MGKIYITGLEVDTLIGVYDWERVRTTQLLLDITLDVDLSAAMQSDDVADTVDYAKVAECIVKVGKESTFELLEAFGSKVMETVLANFSVASITLKILIFFPMRKPLPLKCVKSAINVTTHHLNQHWL